MHLRIWYVLNARRRFCIILVVGLAVNVALGWPLIQYYGLHGAVIATLIANLIVMLFTFESMRRLGCCMGFRTLALSAFPAVLLFGATVSSAGIAFLFYLASRTDYLLSDQDREEINAVVIPS